MQAPVDSNDELGDLTDAFNDMVTELSQAQRMRDLFGRYVSQEIAEQVLKDGGMLGGTNVQATAFVSRPPDPGLTALAAQVIGDNLPTQLRIEAIGVNTPVVPLGWHLEGDTAVYDSPGYSAGFLVTSAPPGTLGNAALHVLASFRDHHGHLAPL